MFTRTETSASLSARKPGQTLIAAAVSALALTALPAGAQTSSSTPPASSAGTASGAMVSRADNTLMADLAHANMAEIDSGKLALEKSQNEEVKKFAQKMIDDHTAALQELQTLAQSKGVKLPDSTDIMHKTMTTAMRALSGNAFDNQYMKRAGVIDHQKTIQLLQKVNKNAKDPELKAMATKMMPTVQDHLKMAEQTAGKTGKK